MSEAKDDPGKQADVRASVRMAVVRGCRFVGDICSRIVAELTLEPPTGPPTQGEKKDCDTDAAR